MSDTETGQTMADFIRANGLAMEAERVDSNPAMEDAANMDHWRCTIRKGRSRMVVPCSMGYGHNGKAPKLAQVLECLASDSSDWAHDAVTFADWCANLGYDTDSRKAVRIFKTCQKQAARLREFLGERAFEALLFGVER